MLHRIREACGGDEFSLANVVETDECYFGGKESNKHSNKKLRASRGAVGKIPVMGAREWGGKTVARPVESADQKTATEFAAATVKEGSTVYTDQSRIYGNLPPFTHASVKHGASEYVRGDVHTNSLESVWAVFKRSLHGTWHRVSKQHLPRYVNEATMRLNSGNVKITIDRMNALVRNIEGRRVAYRNLTADNGFSSGARS